MPLTIPPTRIPMTYVLWSLPILTIVALMASGRVGSMGAGVWGVLIAAGVALTVAPVPLAPGGLALAGGKGLWLSWLVAMVILTGLFFREAVSGGGAPVESATADPVLRRRKVFAACFLIGPFAEAATGFGVGQVATVAALQAAGLAPLHVVLLALFSQTLVPWGAMANGTTVGAHLAQLSTTELGVHSALLSVPLLLVWLAMFWPMATAAGVPAGAGERLREVGWVAVAAGLLILANHLFGAEIAGMAALGPLIVLRFWRDDRPSAQGWRLALRLGLPYGVLIAGLAAVRGFPVLSTWLGRALEVRPFADGPSWQVALHPGSWLLAVGVLTALAAARPAVLPGAARRAWQQGKRAVLTISIYLVVARLMADSGTAAALAEGLRQALGAGAVLTIPLLAGALGFLTGSGNATNGLLMASQVSLAGDRLPLAWVAALQNTAAAGLTMLSPARVATGCALIGRPDMERTVYAHAWPLGAAALAVLSSAALLLLLLH